MGLRHYGWLCEVKPKALHVLQKHLSSWFTVLALVLLSLVSLGSMALLVVPFCKPFLLYVPIIWCVYALVYVGACVCVRA